MGDESIVKLVETAIEDLRQGMQSKPNPVIGDPVLFEIVGSDLLRPLPRTDLRATPSRLGIVFVCNRRETKLCNPHQIERN